jgi:hypothetical protein
MFIVIMMSVIAVIIITIMLIVNIISGWPYLLRIIAIVHIRLLTERHLMMDWWWWWYLHITSLWVMHMEKVWWLHPIRTHHKIIST